MPSSATASCLRRIYEQPSTRCCEADAVRVVGDVDGCYYSLASRSLLRVQIPPSFQVWEGNSSGRATFDWKPGTDYLLFMSYSRRDRAWGIDGCGNSGPLNRSASVLAAINSVKANAADPVVDGMVSTDSWATGVADVTVRAIGNGMTFATRTDQAGRFRMRLSAGRYRLEAVRSGWSFGATPLSYENPDALVLAAGGCAQVQFSGAENKINEQNHRPRAPAPWWPNWSPKSKSTDSFRKENRSQRTA